MQERRGGGPATQELDCVLLAHSALRTGAHWGAAHVPQGGPRPHPAPRLPVAVPCLAARARFFASQQALIAFRVEGACTDAALSPRRPPAPLPSFPLSPPQPHVRRGVAPMRAGTRERDERIVVTSACKYKEGGCYSKAPWAACVGMACGDGVCALAACGQFLAHAGHLLPMQARRAGVLAKHPPPGPGAHCGEARRAGRSRASAPPPPGGRR
jgi:hypothetical protein